jgi:hypothetical protein
MLGRTMRRTSQHRINTFRVMELEWQEETIEQRIGRKNLQLEAREQLEESLHLVRSELALLKKAWQGAGLTSRISPPGK